VERPDFARMEILIRQLDEICRESQKLREQLVSEMGRGIWPDRRRPRRADADSGHRRSRRASDRKSSPRKR